MLPPSEHRARKALRRGQHQRNSGALPRTWVPPLPGRHVCGCRPEAHGSGGRTDWGIEKGHGELISADSDTAPGSSAPNSSPFMTGRTFQTGCKDPAWQGSQPFMASKAGARLPARAFLTHPVPHGEELLRDLRSLTKSEAEGISGHQLPFIPIATLCLGQNRWFTMEQESWFCVPALPVQAV